MKTPATLDTLRISITDIRSAGHCVAGARDWFVTRDLDFRAFLRDGISARDFLASGDEQAEQVVQRKLEREHLELDRG